jgi:hypothetical protein
VAGIDVYKTSSAAQLEGGLGALINLSVSEERFAKIRRSRESP